MSNYKKALIYIGIISLLASACIWIGSKAYKNANVSEGKTPISQIQAIYDPALRVPMQGCGSIGVLSNGSCCQLDSSGILRMNTGTGMSEVQESVSMMLPMDSGVLYTVGQVLFYAEQETLTRISNRVSAFTGNGEQIIYCTADNELFLFENGQSVYLSGLPDGITKQIFACENYFVVITSRGVYIYSKDSGLSKTALLMGSSQQYFMYEDWLIVVGDGVSGAIAYDVRSESKQEINLGWNTCEFENQITVAGDGQWLYLSIRSEIWPQFEKEVHTATFRINPKNWAAEEICSEFYSGMVCSTNMIYGWSEENTLFLENICALQ